MSKFGDQLQEKSSEELRNEHYGGRSSFGNPSSQCNFALPLAFNAPIMQPTAKPKNRIRIRNRKPVFGENPTFGSLNIKIDPGNLPTSKLNTTAVPDRTYDDNINYETQECSKCKLFLSVFPITSTKPNNLVCGRCPIEESRYTSIENALSFVKFECRYKTNGCSQKCMPVHMESHEHNCSYRVYTCPILNCAKQLTNSQYFKHFKSHNLINTSGIINHTYQSNKPCQLLRYRDSIFLIQISIINISVTYIGPNKNAEKFLVTLETPSGVFHKSVESYEKPVKDLPISPLMHREQIIYIYITKKESICENYPKKLNCPICVNRMGKPIYQCENGHVICNKCHSTTPHCPTCEREFGSIRNTILESLVEDLGNRYCEMNKCTNLLQSEHRFVCPFAEYMCKICSTLQPNYVTLYNHINSEHTVSTNSFITITANIKEDCTTNHFLLINDYLFEIVQQVENMNVRVSVHLVGPRVYQKEFSWNLVNNTGRKDWLSLRRLCAVGMENSDDFTSANTYVELQEKTVFPFIIDDKFSYTVHVLDTTHDNE